jgi:anti-sigma-K factor RskA/putative zinc finger protein
MADLERGDGDGMENTVGAYVLGATEPVETEYARAHLESCPACRVLEARLRWVTSMLPLSVDPEQPPARLRERILSAAEASTVPRSSTPRTRLRMPQLRGPVIRRPWFSRHALAAVLAAAVIALAGWNIYLTRQLHDAQMAVAGHQLTASSPTLSRASGQVVALRSQGVLLVNFKNMPQPQPGRVYELWLGTISGRMTPAGVFRPDPDGSKLVLLNQDISRYSIIAVTVEPGPNGSRAPTQPPGMSGSV